jgi:carboxypeptidase Q
MTTRTPLFVTLCTVFLAVAALATAADRPADFARSDLAGATTLREKALADDTAYELVRSLTLEVGPRPSGSAGDAAAVAWAQREMRRIGLANVRTQEVIVPHWVRGEASFDLVAPFPMAMPTLALGGSIGTPEGGLEAELVMVEDLDALAKLPQGAVTGRIVFFNKRMDRTRDGSGYARAVAVRSTGPTAAGALGAIGVVIRSMSTSDDRLPHTGTTRYTINAPRVAAVAISNPDADALERHFASGKPVKARMRVTARDLPQKRSANVIGEVPGTDRAAEIVILGAHLDSWDPGVGALDNAAGVAIVMNAARLISQLPGKPRRTVRVVLFANEEFGLSGSLAYVAAAEASGELARHVLGLESDFGAGPVWRFSSRVDPAQLPAVDAIYRALAPFKLVRGDNEARGGADLDALARNGVALLEPGLDGTNYFDTHHTANDTLAKVDPTAIRQSVANFAIAAWLGAQYPGEWQRVTAVKPPRR